MDPVVENAKMKYRMLVVDDKASIRAMLEEVFLAQDFDVSTASSGEDAIEKIAQKRFHVVLTDLSMPNKGGIDVLRAAKSQHPETEVVVITGYGTIETAVEAIRLGAYDFLCKPLNITELERKVAKIIRKIELAGAGKFQTWIQPGVEHLVGASQQTRDLTKMILKVAPTKSSVLITGPTGVGKELVARAIHEAGTRREQPFVALNCAALAPGTLESELFGHESGAFTGATARRIGRFELADKGTLFLDEVGEIDRGVQTKLLRTLQEGEIDRVGGTKTIKVDVRIVAATNRDLKSAIAEGAFREDFYYRLNVFSLNVAPLRERRDDIPALVDHFLRRYSLETEKEVCEIDDEVIGAFIQYPWPGNVRELENVIERAVVLAEDGRITCNELPPEMFSAAAPPNAPSASAAQSASLMQRTDQMEADLIKGALERFKWNKTKAADHLGLKRTTLQYKIKKYGLD